MSWDGGAVDGSGTGARRYGALAWVALVTVWIAWGSTYLAIRAGVETIPPLLMAGVRYLAAGAVLLAVVALRGRRPGRRITWPQLRSVLVVAVLLLVGGNGLVTVAERDIPSGLAALIVATTPVWMVVFNTVSGAGRVGGRVLFGLVLGTAGVALLVGGPGSIATVGPALLVVVAAASWALGSVYSQRASLPPDPLLSTSVQMLGGGAVLAGLAAVRGEFGQLDLGAVSGRSVAGLLWLVVPGSIIALSAYTYVLRAMPSDLVSTYAYVNPVVAVLLGIAVDGEPFTANIAASAAAIVLAVVLIVTSQRRQPAVSRGVNVGVVGIEIVGLGAWCDYVTVDEYRARMTGSARPAEAVIPGEPAMPGLCPPDQVDFEAFARQLNFRVEEFATLSDGRRLILTDDRGWGISRAGAPADDLWADLTAESVETDVRNVVLPDDAEQTGDEHPWAWLAERLRAQGVEVNPEEMRRLPYDVILSRRLQARLSDTTRNGVRVEGETDDRLPVWRIGLAGGLVGILCCVGPTVLALLGVVSAGTAFAWATTLYDGYAWWFRLGGLAVLAVLVWWSLRRRGQCSATGVRRWRWRLLGMLAVAVGTYIGLYALTTWLGTVA